jgi:hypothetical protein
MRVWIIAQIRRNGKIKNSRELRAESFAANGIAGNVGVYFHSDIRLLI